MSIEVKLDEDSFGKGFPKEDETMNGYSFHEIANDKEIYITSQMTDEPILIAVAEDQYNLWRKWNIIAYHAKFIKKDVWVVETDKTIKII